MSQSLNLCSTRFLQMTTKDEKSSLAFVACAFGFVRATTILINSVKQGNK